MAGLSLRLPGRRRGALLRIAGALGVVLTALWGVGAQGGGAAPARLPLQKIVLAMGYIPNVQFAPFYVAAARGYYTAAHLSVTFNYGFAPDLLRQVGVGTFSFANADSDAVVAARAASVPVRYIAAQYQRFPIVVFSLASSHITTAAGLRGKTIGVPGLYGSAYIGLLHLLAQGGLSAKDVRIVAIGYTQPQSIARKQVQAAVGYAMNEPVVLRTQGYQVNVLPLPDAASLVGAGLITSDNVIAHSPDLARRFVQASLAGLRDTLNDPKAAFAIARTQMPPLRPTDVRLQFAVLQAALPYWHVAGRPLGYSSPAAWANLVGTMRHEGQLSHPVALASLYTNSFVR